MYIKLVQSSEVVTRYMNRRWLSSCTSDYPDKSLLNSFQSRFHICSLKDMSGTALRERCRNWGNRSEYKSYLWYKMASSSDRRIFRSEQTGQKDTHMIKCFCWRFCLEGKSDSTFWWNHRINCLGRWCIRLHYKEVFIWGISRGAKFS